MTWNHLHTSSVERASKLFHVTFWQRTVLSHLPLSIRNELKMNKYTRFNNNKHFRGSECIVRGLARKSLTDMSGWSCPYGILSRCIAITHVIDTLNCVNTHQEHLELKLIYNDQEMKITIVIVCKNKWFWLFPGNSWLCCCPYQYQSIEDTLRKTLEIDQNVHRTFIGFHSLKSTNFMKIQMRFQNKKWIKVLGTDIINFHFQLVLIVPRELCPQCWPIGVTANDVYKVRGDSQTLRSDQLICVITVDLNGIVLQGLKFLASTKIFQR